MTKEVTEAEIGFAVMQLCAGNYGGEATFDQMRKGLPSLLKLSATDRILSTERNGEEMWEQEIRNIKSHSEVPGNPICEGCLEHMPKEGYKITNKGRRLLKTSGL